LSIHYFLYRNSVKQCLVFTVGITGEPEPLTEKDLREASNAIDVFGEQLVNKFRAGDNDPFIVRAVVVVIIW
jgi:hypothetical protein